MRVVYVLGLAIVLFLRLSLVTPSEVVECSVVDDSFGEWCTTCTAGDGGVYFRCSEPHTFKWCRPVPPLGYTCAQIAHSCGGIRTNYANSMNCQMQMNPTGTEPCTYEVYFAAINIEHPCS